MASPSFESELAARLASAERETPGVACDPAEFRAMLRGLLAALAEPHAELGRLHVEDMYLVWALAKQDRAALARFEREHMARLSIRVSAAHDLPPGELEQAVRTRLLMSEGASPPRITRYAGRGPFGAWLRMVAKRVALDLLRARGARRDRELTSPGVATDPEIDYLKLRYAADFKLALEQALAHLGAREVTLLKLSYLEQLSPSAIGVMYGVSARTVQRWLVDLKEDVLLRMRRALEQRLSLGPAELDSLLRVMQSQLQVSLHRVLGSAFPA